MFIEETFARNNILMADITGVTEPIPVEFLGTFEGNGKTIGLNIPGTTNNDRGLFAEIGEDGIVRNLNVTGTVSGENNVGSIAGINRGTIERVSSSVIITATGNNVGGIAGDMRGNTGRILNCYYNGNVTGGSNVGGISGNAAEDTRIENCYAAGTVSGSASVAGILGYNGNRMVIQNNIALQTLVIASDPVSNAGIARVAFLMGTLNTITNNHARADMAVNGEFVLTPADSGTGAINGENIPNLTRALFTSTFTNFSTNWKWGTNAASNVPILAWQSGAGTTINITPPAGSAGNPFVVNNKADLDKVGTDTDGWTPSAHYKLTADIVIEDPWTPIGTANTPFTGTFDGDGHTIDLVIDDADIDNFGLFGVIGNGGVVKNLGLTGDIIGVADNIGGIAGQNNGTIERVSSSIAITATGYDNVGGIAGTNNGIIQDSYSIGDVTGNENVGGIAGQNDGTIENCFVESGVSGAGNVGGIAGNNIAGIVENSVVLTNGLDVVGGDASGDVVNSFDATGIPSDLVDRESFFMDPIDLGWNFGPLNPIWKWPTGATRPMLNWEP
jgi:hypothetical protein